MWKWYALSQDILFHKIGKLNSRDLASAALSILLLKLFRTFLESLLFYLKTLILFLCILTNSSLLWFLGTACKTVSKQSLSVDYRHLCLTQVDTQRCLVLKYFFQFSEFECPPASCTSKRTGIRTGSLKREISRRPGTNINIKQNILRDCWPTVNYG